jgi:hypothetical protein
MNQNINESRLVYEVMQELGKHGAVYRCNSGSVQLPNGKRFHGMPKGFADIMLVMHGGIACFIECKIGKNATSPEQERFIERMRNLGARVGVARSVAEALQICGISA